MHFVELLDFSCVLSLDLGYQRKKLAAFVFMIFSEVHVDTDTQEHFNMLERLQAQTRQGWKLTVSRSGLISTMFRDKLCLEPGRP